MPELTPGPVKVYHMGNLKDKEDESKVHGGYSLQIFVDYRDVYGAPKVLDENSVLVRKAIPPFTFQCWRRSHNTLCIKAPLLSFSAWGNDNELIREDYSEDNPDLMLSIDDSRKKYHQRHGGSGKHNDAFMYYEVTIAGNVMLDGACLDLNSMKKNDELQIDGLDLYANLSTTQDDDWDYQRVTIEEHGTKITKSCPIWKQTAVPRFFWVVADRNKATIHAGADTEIPEELPEGVAAMKKKKKKRKPTS